jgi:hypothetical protein
LQAAFASGAGAFNVDGSRRWLAELMGELSLPESFAADHERSGVMGFGDGGWRQIAPFAAVEVHDRGGPQLASPRVTEEHEAGIVTEYFVHTLLLLVKVRPEVESETSERIVVGQVAPRLQGSIGFFRIGGIEPERVVQPELARVRDPLLRQAAGFPVELE